MFIGIHYNELSKFNKTGVVVNFMCQFNWATRCSDIWLYSILGVAESTFPDKINIWIRKEDHCHQSEWASPSPLRTWIKPKG